MRLRIRHKLDSQCCECEIQVEPVELAITEITQLTTLLIKIDLAMMLTLH